MIPLEIEGHPVEQLDTVDGVPCSDVHVFQVGPVRIVLSDATEDELAQRLEQAYWRAMAARVQQRQTAVREVT